MRLYVFCVYLLMGAAAPAFAGDSVTEANTFCSNCSHDEKNAFIQAKEGLLKQISMASSGRCETSGDCPGASLCKNGRCVQPNGDGTECDTSGECPGASLCKHGRCETSNGDGVECDTSGECPGVELCRHHRCEHP